MMLLKVILLDTHPVPPTLGGIQNGLIVRGSNSVSGRKQLNEWLQRRFNSESSTYAVNELHMYDITPEAGCDSSHNLEDEKIKTFKKNVKTAFIEKLTENITQRFVDNDIM